MDRRTGIQAEVLVSIHMIPDDRLVMGSPPAMQSAIQRLVRRDRTETGRLEITEDTGLVFVLIPGGTFYMGAQRKDSQLPNFDIKAMNNEHPVYAVTLESSVLSFAVVIVVALAFWLAGKLLFKQS